MNNEDKILKDSSLNQKELIELREKFKIEYAKTKGWDPESLTIAQLKEIHSDKNWQTPMLLS